MSHDFPLSLIRRYTSEELEVLWRQDFQRLVVTAIADAEGRVHIATADRLRSSDWCEGWLEALSHAVAVTESAVERMTYAGDVRLPRLTERLKKLLVAQQESRRRLKALDAAHNEELKKERNSYSAARYTKVLLRAHFRDWFDARMKEEMSRKGLPQHAPLRETSYEDGVHLVEDLIKRGLLDYSVTAEVKKFQAMSDQEFRDLVADDTSGATARVEALRHPLLLNDWMAALQDLQEATWSHMETEVGMTGNLPPLDYRCLAALRPVEVDAIMRRRLFYRSVVQRMDEWRRVRRHLVREASDCRREMDRPWAEALDLITDEIPDAHPQEYAAVRKALDPFGWPTPGSDQLHPSFKGTRGAFSQTVKEALRHGTWIRLLGD